MDPQRRRLPHIYPDGLALFVTWHLYGSLPHKIYPPADKQNAGRAFVWMDRRLDSVRSGPMYLRQDAIAKLVVSSIFYAEQELKLYELRAFVVMPNHVHLLAQPLAEPRRFLQVLKGYTARQANLLLNRTGEPFWQRESYDHYVRNAEEERRIARYIENNPVKAGLAASPEEYPWSSANPEWKAETNLGSAR